MGGTGDALLTTIAEIVAGARLGALDIHAISNNIGAGNTTP